jgi:hypothetical protein
MKALSHKRTLDFRAEDVYGQVSQTKKGPFQMEQKTVNRATLAVRREAYRLWFEFLKLAQSSTNHRVREAFAASSQFYAPWNMKDNDRFDPWWRTHQHLFDEKHTVRVLTAGEAPLDSTALVVEIPLTKSPTDLMKEVSVLIMKAHGAIERKSRKTKRLPRARYRLSEESEPKLRAVRTMLNVYRDVYLKELIATGKAPKGIGLLDSIRHYRDTAKKRDLNLNWVDRQRSEADDNRPLRNARRYIQKAEAIILNVAKGEFPGRY